MDNIQVQSLQFCADTLDKRRELNKLRSISFLKLFQSSIIVSVFRNKSARHEEVVEEIGHHCYDHCHHDMISICCKVVYPMH